MIEFGTRKRYQSAREILQDLTGQSPATSIQTPATPRYSPTPATPVIQTPPPPKVAANIVLKSARGVNYSKLQQLLAAGNWKEADEETGKVMCQVAGKGWGRSMTLGDIDNFPCEDLRTIDQLWLHYSNGKFGFSVQKEIYESLGGTREYENLGGTREYNEKLWEKFGDCVGWRKGDYFKEYGQLTFNNAAPKAHLPFSPQLLDGWIYFYANSPIRFKQSLFNHTVVYLFSRAKTCNL